MNEHHQHTWTHDHVYLGAGHARAEARTRFVVYLTAAFMVVEIVAGIAYGSMALLADGVHMATHVGAPVSPRKPIDGTAPRANGASLSARGNSAISRRSAAHSSSA
jgi:hypothetical protein